MRTLVIGGSGFVGHAVVRALVAEGHAVSVLNRRTRPLIGVEQLIADRNDAKAVTSALLDREFDCVIDTNAYTGEQARIMVTALAGRVTRAAVISSAAVYSDGAATPAREIAPAGGGSAWAEYGRGKVEVEEVYREARFPFARHFAHLTYSAPTTISIAKAGFSDASGMGARFWCPVPAAQFISFCMKTISARPSRPGCPEPRMHSGRFSLPTISPILSW
ncbi:NAD-dependent epimerase/dehydratase family protein [Mesorhizobium waimense]|uniref:UDP-glucose 4-epimerase n=1 Tax=Mesorhizobium waimense TaxID=1300307 RepID=A0A3A5K0E0_9HYPH|nr:NAD-dependent epimerase/dehydratase family protein [Mesorhizobium waimense]RJT28510.1 NAD-dependent epimerase/dehydratase family protein [Mesorhizobium waimense]